MHTTTAVSRRLAAASLKALGRCLLQLVLSRPVLKIPMKQPILLVARFGFCFDPLCTCLLLLYGFCFQDCPS